MYLGSVRFYKHLIITAALLIFFAPLIACTALGIQNHNLQKKIIELSQPSAPEPLSGSGIESSSTLSSEASVRDSGRAYPELFIQRSTREYAAAQPRTVYLTFDDGPSKLTPRVLDLLKENDVKATFFVVYKDDPQSRSLYNRILADGHTLGVHSTTHCYEEVYQSLDSYLSDFAKTANLLDQTTGRKPEIFRFPGGSINSYNKHNYQTIIDEMLARGYEFYDWNVSAADAAAHIGAEEIYENVISGVSGKNKAIVLMHDSASKTETLNALPDIIRSLKEAGYQFAALDSTVEPITFGYPN